MDYMSVKQDSKKWGFSERHVQKLFETNRIPGAEHGYVWAIPKNAKKPARRKKIELRIPHFIFPPYQYGILKQEVFLWRHY